MKKKKLVPIVALSSLLVLGTPFIASCSQESPTNQTVSVTGVEVSATKTTLKVGETLQLNVTVSPANATTKDVTYSVSPEGVVSVSTTGLVTALKAGNATVTVTTVDGSKTDTISITVEEETPTIVSVTGVELNIDKTSIEVGQTAQLEATVLPENATNKNISFTAAPDNIITISETGLVTGVGAGTATITVTTEDGNKTDTVQITVTQPVVEETITIDVGDKTEYTIGAGEDLVLEYSATSNINGDVSESIEIEDYNDPDSFNKETKTFNSKIAGEHVLSFFVPFSNNPDDGVEKDITITVTPDIEETFDTENLTNVDNLTNFGTYKDNFELGIDSPMYSGANAPSNSIYLSSLENEAISGNSLVIDPNKTAGSAANSIFFAGFNNAFPKGVKANYTLSFKYKVISGTSGLDDIYIGLSWDDFTGINRNFIATTGSEIGRVYEFSTRFTEATIPTDKTAYFFLFKSSGTTEEIRIAIDDITISVEECPETTDVIATSEQLRSNEGFTFNWADKSCPVVNGESIAVDSIKDETIKSTLKAHPEYFGTNVKHLTDVNDHTINGTTADSLIADMTLQVEFVYYAVNYGGVNILMMGAGNPTVYNGTPEDLGNNIYRIRFETRILAGQSALNIYVTGNPDFDIYLGNTTLKLVDSAPIPEDQTPGGHTIGESWKKTTRQWGDVNEANRSSETMQKPETVTGELMEDQVTRMSFKAGVPLNTTIEFFQAGGTLEQGQVYDLVIPYFVEKDFPEGSKLCINIDNNFFYDLDSTAGYHVYEVKDFTPSALVDFFSFYGTGGTPTEDLVFYVSYVEYTLVATNS